MHKVTVFVLLVSGETSILAKNSFDILQCYSRLTNAEAWV